MVNLIVNAIQAMSGIGDRARELVISVDAVPSEGGVRVGVRDTGPGLSPETLSRLFEPFYTTKPNGMGMGLAICRSIIEAHGGRPWATACEPHGALFQFTIPARPLDRIAPHQTSDGARSTALHPRQAPKLYARSSAQFLATRQCLIDTRCSLTRAVEEVCGYCV